MLEVLLNLRRYINSYFTINALLVCCLVFFKEYFNSQIRINIMVKEQRQLLVLQGCPQLIILSYWHSDFNDLSLQ